MNQNKYASKNHVSVQTRVKECSIKMTEILTLYYISGMFLLNKMPYTINSVVLKIGMSVCMHSIVVNLRKSY